MGKYVERAKKTLTTPRRFTARFLFLLCVGLLFGCRQESANEEQEEVWDASKDKDSGISEEASDSGEQSQNGEAGKIEEAFSPKQQLEENRAEFLEMAAAQGISPDQSEKLYQRLCEDGIFQEGERKLTGLLINDMDENGRMDMLAMVLDAREPSFYGCGALWIYMNEDEPYCFDEESCSFYGWFDVFWVDIDNDENVEIIFSAQGTGCGAVGDTYKAVFKYKDHTIEQMKLPSDFEEDYDQGLRVELIQEPEADSYSAYCSYFDEQIFFRGENAREGDILNEPRSVGGNVRGFYGLRAAEYEGKRVLQASEYLHGEGGIVHCVAIAQFLITWEEDGTPKVVKWWIEENENGWVNGHGNRIYYKDGYYYYASQKDHYYLYRCDEDGSNPQCLAKIHPGNIWVRNDEIYFVNLSDGQGIYRMKTDGTGMEKLCESGQNLQISAEYVYFTSTYEAEYDKSGMVTEEPSEYDDDFLYRMKKDGSERELIATDVWQYVLSDGCPEVWYTGSIYCIKWMDQKYVLYRMDLDGQNEQEMYRFDARGRMMVYGGNIYYAGDFYGEREQISRLDLWNGEITTFQVPLYTDCCIYDGYLYTLNEEAGDHERQISVCRMDLDGENCEVIYKDTFTCERLQGGCVSDLYATGEGVFFRMFASEGEGCQWYRLIKDWEQDEWKTVIWEYEDVVPVTLPAQNIEYGELSSVKSMMKSTPGYEEYMTEDLEFEEYYRMEDEKEYNPYRIWLPQFNERIAGYKKINQYFQNAYQEALKEKEIFFETIGENEPEGVVSWFQMTGYDYIYIGEKYITVARYEGGYWGGIRSWTYQEPVTFDRKSGEVVSLEKILDMPEREAVAKLTGSVYKYMEGIGRGTFFLEEEDILTEEYDPEQFFLFQEGIGLYYERYAIDCGAAGDYLFIVPWEEL